MLRSRGLDSSAITALPAAILAEEDERIRSFAVDFVGQAENFHPDELRPAPDTPYVHDVAEHVGTQHAEIVLGSDALADPAIRRKVVAARDIPTGVGDMDTSPYPLCRAIREHSTVALSGESADEIFGGYRQFHDPEVQRAHDYRDRDGRRAWPRPTRCSSRASPPRSTFPPTTATPTRPRSPRLIT